MPARNSSQLESCERPGCQVAATRGSGAVNLVSIEFAHPPSLSNRCCRAAILSALAAHAADRIMLVHGGLKQVYEGASARALSGLAACLSGLAPALCPACTAELGNLWADPLSCYYRARSQRCASCDTELRRIASLLKGTEFINVAVRAGKPDLVWQLPATTVPAFFAAELLAPPPVGELLERYTVGDVGVSLHRHPDRPDTLMLLDYPELSLTVPELETLTAAYTAVVSSRPATTAILDAFKAKCIAAVNAAARSVVDRQKLATILLRHTTGFGALEPLLKDSNLQDIFVDSRSPLVHVVHSRWGECLTNLHMTPVELAKLATRLRALSGRPLDTSSPVLHAEIEELGVRVAGICPPSTYRGVGFAFRRRKASPWTLPEFVQARMLDARVAGLLSFLADGQASTLITGMRASGKTSLLTALLLEIPQSTRIIAIEDTPEIPIETLQAMGFKIEHLKTEAWARGFELSAEAALRTSLRLGESTLVMGEVRGPEARSLFEAMRIGAAGNVVLGTIHGATAHDTWDRVVNDLGVPSSSFKAVDVIVTIGSMRAGDDIRRQRRLLAITEVRKGWKGEPTSRDFVPIATFMRSRDSWKVSLGRSHAVRQIAKVKGISVAEALRNIAYRGRMKADLVQLARRRPDASSVGFVVAANNAYIRAAAATRSAAQAYKRWSAWLRSYA